jgi:hypothetical protein
MISGAGGYPHFPALELQSILARGLRKGLYPTMVQKTVAIKDNLFDFFPERRISNSSTNYGCPFLVSGILPNLGSKLLGQ